MKSWILRVINQLLITVQHLRSHPVGVSNDRVSLLPVAAPEHPLLVGRFLRGGLDLVLHDQSGQSEVCHDHRVVLAKEQLWWVFFFQSDRAPFVAVSWSRTSLTRQL